MKPNPRLEEAIAAANTDTLAVAYALLRVADAIREYAAAVKPPPETPQPDAPV